MAQYIRFMKFILKKDGGFFIKRFKELKPSELKAIASDIRLKIISELKKEPMYPNQLAKKLKMHEQKIYYHINALKKAGIISVVKTEEIKGSLATFYGVKADAFGVELDGEYEPIRIKENNSNLRRFFKEFNKNGYFDGFIVVGSPEPHGPFKTIARDGHYAGQVGLIIGSIMNVKAFSIKLDTDVINENKLGENMVVIGGPGTNLITAKLNNYMPVKFNERNYWTFIKGKKEYTHDSCGIIVKMKNPFNKEKTVIVLAGLRSVGTKSAIIGLQNIKYKEGEFVRIIKGYDYDGDGKVDSVEVLE